MGTVKTAAEIREAFLSFFEARGHVRLPSDSLIPTNDPTLLFTGAGMNQFKDEFLGKGRRGLKRVATAQKCLRVPDLENVGTTPRHHTFFEMLGNFSFGDYFKREVIPWEWELFTETLGCDGERMLATVYRDDDEAYAIWRDVVGLPAERIYRFGEKENFWPGEAPSKGPNGPCGPCSELYFDQEPDLELPEREGLDALPERFLEVGNFVFTQFDRQASGELPPLPQKNIDVGLGLERIAAVLQGAASNYETDLFAPALERLQELSDKRYGGDPADDVRMRRIADHARAVFFCVADGAVPARDGRGYVVRKILRRAVRDGVELGMVRPFFAALLPAVQATMGEAYPQLREQQGTIEALVQGEEERFRDVYRHGISRLEAMIEEVKAEPGATVFPGDFAFELHDTYGFPLDTSAVIARDHGLEVDQEGFERAMEAQRERARAGSEISGDVFTESVAAQLAAAGAAATEFMGYERDEAEATVVGLVRAGRVVDVLAAGEEGAVVLDRTPFYAEGGGQVGDRGELLAAGAAAEQEVVAVFLVGDCRKEGDYHLHRGRAAAELRTGLELRARIVSEARRATEAHHTATHLMHAALKEVLGAHVNQAGSLVDPERLRFDYTHPEAPSREQLEAIEDLVHREVMAGKEVDKSDCSLAEAKARGVVALFGEKYGDEVRVVDVPGFSQELCGGTHVRNTAAIGPFRILSDRALAAGVRRIEAGAGRLALASFRADERRIRELEVALKAPADRLLERIQALKAQLKEARQARRGTAPDASSVAGELAAAGGDAAFAWMHLDGVGADGIRALADGLKKRDGLPGVVLLVGGDGDAVPFAFLCRQPASGVRAGDLAKRFGAAIGGGGGGRPDFAQGQGTKADAVEAAARELAAALGAPA